MRMDNKRLREVSVQKGFDGGAFCLPGSPRRHEIGESGVFLGLGDVYTFDEDWYGQLAVGAGDNVLRLLPPLNIEEAHLDEAVEKIGRACAVLEAGLAAEKAEAAGGAA